MPKPLVSGKGWAGLALKRLLSCRLRMGRAEQSKRKWKSLLRAGYTVHPDLASALLGRDGIAQSVLLLGTWVPSCAPACVGAATAAGGPG